MQSISFSSLLGFGLVALGMVLTPGPNMIYLISRSICQGHRAGYISLAGIVTGFLFYLACAAAGITALLFAIPFAYDVLRFSGAAYLLFLAWQAVKPGGTSPFQVKQLGRDSDKKLYLMGLFTSLLNPKVALLYLALLPQFIDPLRGNIFGQSLALGLVQICVSITVNSTYVAAAGSIALFLKNRPNWILVQRWVMGFVLAAMAIQISLQVRK